MLFSRRFTTCRGTIIVSASLFILLFLTPYLMTNDNYQIISMRKNSLKYQYDANNKVTII